MNKKMMIVLKIILVVAVTLILILTLSDSSKSKRDMIVGKWASPVSVLQLDNDGTAYMEGPRGGMQGTWSLHENETTLVVKMDGQSEEFDLTSVSESELCLSLRGEINCFNRYTGDDSGDEFNDYYYEEEVEEDGYEDYYYEEEVEEERYYDVYGREHNHISTCYTCGISYTVQTLPYLGKYCSQTCCGAYERDLRDCGY